MTHCSVCKQNHDGTGCPMDDGRPVYNQAMDVIEKLKAEIAEKTGRYLACKQDYQNAIKEIVALKAEIAEKDKMIDVFVKVLEKNDADCQYLYDKHDAEIAEKDARIKELEGALEKIVQPRMTIHRYTCSKCYYEGSVPCPDHNTEGGV